jgi:hypothetical protein
MLRAVPSHQSESLSGAEFIDRGANPVLSRRRSPMGNDCRCVPHQSFGTSPDPGAGTAPGSFEGVVLVDG